MKIRIALSLSLVLIVTSNTARPQEASRWIQLFNGRDLTGWKANTDPQAFKVVKGTIRVNAKGKAAHLFYVGAKPNDSWVFKNFELEATVRAIAGSNSGIFIHTGPVTHNRAGHLRDGYEIQLNSSKKEERKTGSLYAVRDLSQSPVDETEWFVINIRVVGKKIQVRINNKQVVEYTEPRKPKRKFQRIGRRLSDFGGMIALQAHDPKSTWYFREIRIRKLLSQ